MARNLATIRSVLPLLLVSSTVHGQVIKDMDVVTPRHFGYVVGDTIRHDVILTLSSPYRLDEDTLPKAGRLNRWLELAPPSVRAERREDGVRYFIGITYQLVNAPAQLETVIIPQQDFLVTDGVRALSAFVPEWAFTVAPITKVGQANDPSFPALRPEHPPTGTAVEARIRRLVAFGAILVALLMYLAFLRWVVPLVARRRRPFANAYRALRRLEKGNADKTRYAAGLRLFHQAVNETAGQVVFADGLDEFFVKKSRFADLHTEVAELFDASRDFFFASPDTSRTPMTSLKPLMHLCRRCREIERALP